MPAPHYSEPELVPPGMTTTPPLSPPKPASLNTAGSLGRACELVALLSEALQGALQEAGSNGNGSPLSVSPNRSLLQPTSPSLDNLSKTNSKTSAISSLAGPVKSVDSRLVEVPPSTDVDVKVELLSCWQELRLQGKSLGTFGKIDHIASFNSTSKNNFPGEGTPKLDRLSALLVSNPDSRLRLAWDAMSLAVLVYDFTIIPLEFIGLPHHNFFDYMSFLTPIFWTCDCLISFFRGYLSKSGRYEKRLHKTVRHYVMSWFMFDIMVLAIDWISFATKVGVDIGEGDIAVGLLRYMRLLRVARALKMFSAIKVLIRLSEMLAQIRSEFVLMFLGIFRMICLILFMCHLVACGWYGIGTYNDDWHDAWVKARKLENRSFGYRYMTALHWALTQFTPSSMEVHPENAVERLYAIVVVMVGMFMFSSLVSNVTNTMSCYRQANGGRIEARASLRRWLDENSVSLDLTSRVFRWMQDAENSSGRGRIHEEELKLMQYLPRKLRNELHEEVWSPILRCHPFFFCFGAIRRKSVHALYEKALREVSIKLGKELFVAEESAEDLFFVLSGKLEYQDDETSTVLMADKSVNSPSHQISFHQKSAGVSSRVFNSIEAGIEWAGGTPSSNRSIQAHHTWISEAALWIKWQHKGTLTADVDSEVIGVQAKPLQDLMVKELSAREPAYYARLFAAFFSARPDLLSDLPADKRVIESLTRECFGQDAANRIFGNDQGQDSDFLVEALSFYDPDAKEYFGRYCDAATACSYLMRSDHAYRARAALTPEEITEHQRALQRESVAASQAPDHSTYFVVKPGADEAGSFYDADF